MRTPGRSLSGLFSILFMFILSVTPFVAYAEELNALTAASLGIQLPISESSPTNVENIVEGMKKLGVTYEHNGEHLNIFADEQLVLAAIPQLQKLGAINAGLSQNDVNAHPITYSGAISMFFAALILPQIYQNPVVNELHVTMHLIGADEYGKQIKLAMMSFDFNRELHSRINWNDFLPQNFMKIAPNFKFEKWYEERLSNE